MKRFIALLLAAIMIFALAACAGGEKSTTAADFEPLTKDDVIKFTFLSHASWPYKEDWKVWDYIAEGTGCTLEVNSIPNTEASTKIPIMFAAPELLPDVLAFGNKGGTDRYARQGALIAFDDVKEYMPNYNAWVDSLTEDEYNNHVKIRVAADGKIYHSPVKGREISQNLRAWLYRKDIFEKHNIALPTTFDEVYEVCKQLKALYPDSYPFCMRSPFVNFNVSGPSWSKWWNLGAYYDFDTEEWKYGALEDVTLDMIKFYNKLYEEKLVPEDCLTISTSAWQELFTTNRGFIMPEYQTRIDFFNGLAKANNPDFDLAAFVPPVANPELGVPMVGKYNVDPYGFAMCNTSDEKRIANAAKYADWFYSEDAYDLISWGKEGETYEIVDGERKFITDEIQSQPNTLYGLALGGTFCVIDPKAVEAMETEAIARGRQMVLDHTLPYANPTTWMSLSDDDSARVADISTAISSYIEETVSKMILGQLPFSAFDEMREEIKKMGVDEVLKIYGDTYEMLK